MYKIQKIIKNNTDIMYTLFYRIWSIISGSITIILVPIFLTPIQQGIYYTFMALIGMQIFFELGLNHVLVQMTSHTRGNTEIKIRNDARVAESWEIKVASLVVIAKNWYSIMALLLFMVLSIGGYIFFNANFNNENSDWSLVWFILVLTTSVNLALSGQLAVCEGLGEIAQVSKLRLIQSIFGGLVAWVLFYMGAGIWAILAMPISGVFGSGYWLYKRKLYKKFNIKKYQKIKNIEYSYCYMKDIFPLQWRIALSWGSAYFIYNFITPVIFAVQGPVEAGKIGLAFNVFNSIGALGMSWIYAKIPQFGVFIVRNERRELDDLFNKNIFRSVLVTLSILLVFMMCIIYVDNPKIINRLPSMDILLILSIITIVNLIINAMSSYMRAHGNEPMLINSIVSALLVGSGVYFSAAYGVKSTIITYASIIILITLPWCFILFKKYRIIK